MRTICVALLALGLCVFAPGCKKRTDSTNADSKSGVSGTSGDGKGKRGTFTVGKSTTVVTGPVDSTGHIDYTEALNERLAKGVTPENNANVAIWKVFGPSAAGVKPSNGYFEKLKMTAPPATGDYFVSLKSYAESRGGSANFDSLKRFSEQPWTANQDATISGWLQANEKPLVALREAVKKTHYFNPMIPERGDKGSKGLISSRLPSVQASRDLAAALACRAMLYLGNNQPAEARQDLMACHRLGRHIGRGGVLIEGLVGMAVEAIACRGEIAFLDRGKLDAKSIEACLRDLMALPPLADVTEKIDISERFTFLDHIMQINSQGIGYLEAMGGNAKAPNVFADLMLDGIDWDPALETANKWFDRLTAAAREKDRSVRMQKLNQLMADLMTLKEKATEPTRLAKMLRDGNAPAKAKGEAIGDVLVTLLMPAAPKVMEASDRTQQTFDTVIVGYACAWYQRFNGKYPAKLADLAPTYLQQVPKDMFTGNDLIYKPDANGFLLYSVGVNGRDDGGRGYTDQPAGDDLVVRISQPTK